jgi:hypothetical protein
MMNIIQVVAADSANHGPAKTAPSLAEGTGSGKTTATTKASKGAPAAAPGIDKMKMN